MSTATCDANGGSASSSPTTDVVVNDVATTFEAIRVINEGHYGTVVAAKHIATGQVRALKVVPKHKVVGPAAVGLAREKHILRLVKHPNIIGLFETLTSPHEVVLVMELMDGDLIHYMERQRRPLTMASVACIMRQLITAIAFLHKHGIAHRDVKADNLLVSENPNATDGMPIAKLGDFGLAKFVTLKNTPCGTSWYMAPQIIRAIEDEALGVDQPTTTTTTEEVLQFDMWACGVVMYFMIGRKMPFPGSVKEARGRRTLLEAMRRGPTFVEAHWAGATREAKDLCSRLLSMDPARRLDAASALSHPFLVQACTPSVAVTPEPARPLADGAANEDGDGDVAEGDEESLHKDAAQGQEANLIAEAMFLDPEEEHTLAGAAGPPKAKIGAFPGR